MSHVILSRQPYAKLYKIHWASRTDLKMAHGAVIGTKTKYVLFITSILDPWACSRKGIGWRVGFVEMRSHTGHRECHHILPPL
jgi:hypothetical protein